MHRPVIVIAFVACLAGTASAQAPGASPYGTQGRGGYGDAGPGAPDDYGQGGGGYPDGYGGYGYAAPAYRPQAPYQGGQPGMPSYQSDESYGGTDDYDSTDARGASQGVVPPTPPQRAQTTAEYRRQQQAYRAQMDDYRRRLRAYQGAYGGYGGGGSYGDRAAELRARADACERGDDSACG